MFGSKRGRHLAAGFLRRRKRFGGGDDLAEIVLVLHRALRLSEHQIIVFHDLMVFGTNLLSAGWTLVAETFERFDDSGNIR